MPKISDPIATAAPKTIPKIPVAEIVILPLSVFSCCILKAYLTIDFMCIIFNLCMFFGQYYYITMEEGDEKEASPRTTKNALDRKPSLHHFQEWLS